MHRPWAVVLASVAACAGAAVTQTSTPSGPVHQLLDSEASLAPRLGAER